MDSAFQLCPVEFDEIPVDQEALAMAVAFGENDGGEFDWDRMNWVERRG